MRKALRTTLCLALACAAAGCAGSRRLRALQTQRYLSEVPLGTDIASIKRELGPPAAGAAYDIGGRGAIELVFYRTTVRSSGLGLAGSARYTPLFFEGGRLIAVGWESPEPEFSREDTEKVLTQARGGSAGKMVK